MGEILQIGIGQAGIRIADVCWKQFCYEHQINQACELEENPNEFGKHQSRLNSIYNEVSEGRFVPRNIFIDTESSIIDQIRKGEHKNLYNSGYFIHGKEDSTNVFMKGRNTIKKELVEKCMNSIEKIAETCQNLKGIIIYHSLNGGTGSGLGGLIMERIKQSYSKKLILTYSQICSPNSDGAVQYYNNALAIETLQNYSDIAVFFDNQALNNLSSNMLHCDSPSYYNINQILALQMAQITQSMRFNGNNNLNATFEDLIVNLIPYQKIKYLMCSWAPFVTKESVKQQKNYTIFNVTQQLFNCDHFSLTNKLNYGYYMACSLLYRGEYLCPSEIIHSVNSIRGTQIARFADWCHTGIKIGMNTEQNKYHPEFDFSSYDISACMLANSSSIKSNFQKIANRFDDLYAKRAFVHWFVGEGIDEDFFLECRETLAYIDKDYESSSIEDFDF